MTTTGTRLTALEQGFKRLVASDEPKVSEILKQGLAEMRAGTYVQEPLDIAQLELDAKKPGIEGEMARGWLRIHRWHEAEGKPAEDHPTRSTGPVAP